MHEIYTTLSKVKLTQENINNELEKGFMKISVTEPKLCSNPCYVPVCARESAKSCGTINKLFVILHAPEKYCIKGK